MAKLLLVGAPWQLRCCWQDAAGRGAVAKKLATPWRSAIGKMLAGTPWQQRQERWQQRLG